MTEEIKTEVKELLVKQEVQPIPPTVPLVTQKVEPPVEVADTKEVKKRIVSAKAPSNVVMFKKPAPKQTADSKFEKTDIVYHGGLEEDPSKRP
jgi:hypothetical protein